MNDNTLYPDDFPSFKRGFTQGVREWIMYLKILSLGVLTMFSIVFIILVLLVWALGEDLIGWLSGNRVQQPNEDDR